MLKLLSLFLAVGIWLVVIGEEKLEFSFPAPLVLRGLPEGLALAQPPPDQVVVRLRAPEALLKRLGAGDIDARLNLADLTPGEHLVPLRRDQVNIPFGAELLTVTPEVVSLVLEAKVSREVRVEPNLDGAPPPGMKIGGVSVEPPRVVVEGPESAVSAVSSISTERIPVSRKESFSASVNVLSGNPLLRVVGESIVKVTVALVPDTGNGKAGAAEPET